MVLLIVFPIVVFVMFIHATATGAYPPDGFYEWVPFVFFAAMFSLLLALLMRFVTYFLLGFVPILNWKRTSWWKLAALRLKPGMSGTFFLGTGTIEGVQTFFYYFTRNDGALVPDQIGAHNVRIYEQNRTDGKLEKYTAVYPVWAWIFLPPFMHETRFEFHIPKGSVVRGYSI